MIQCESCFKKKRENILEAHRKVQLTLAESEKASLRRDIQASTDKGNKERKESKQHF